VDSIPVTGTLAIVIRSQQRIYVIFAANAVLDLRVGSIKSTQVDLGLPSRVKSV